MCGLLGGVALIAVLAMLGLGAVMSQPGGGTAVTWSTWAAKADAECMMMDNTTNMSHKVEGGGELWAVLDRGCTHTAFNEIEAFDRSTLHTPVIKGVRVGRVASDCRCSTRERWYWRF